MDNNTRTKTDWLKKLADNPDLWEKRAYSEMPAVIAHEYERLHDLALQNNVYGVMLQIKDVYEIILKYPCVLGLCICRYEKSPAGMEVYDSIMLKIFEKLPSFGDWRDIIANALRKYKDYLPASLVKILENTYTLVTDSFVGKGGNGTNGIDIINWRNNNIGHGALRLDEDEDLKREIISMVKKLKKYFGTGNKISICGEYDNIILMQGDCELVGAQAATLKNGLTPFSLVIKNDEAFPMPFEDLKYILPFENKICFFDAYINAKQKSKYLDYVAGCLNLRPRDFFYELYRKLEQDGKIRRAQSFSKEVTDTEIEKLLAGLDRTDNYQEPDYILKWMETKLQKERKGCYMLRMGRGMGKSTFASYMDGSYSRRDKKSQAIQTGSIIRTYHCSRNQIRSVNDFVVYLNSAFLEADHHNGSIKDIEGVFKTIERDEQGAKAEATAELLNSYAKYFEQTQGKKVVLIVDGVDEIVDRDMFDYFPDPDRLDDGVYIFYTSRPDEELPVNMRNLIGDIKVQESHAVFADDEDYQKIVIEYANQELKHSVEKKQHWPNGKSDSLECNLLAKKAGFNFLRLRLLLPVYCSGHDIEAAALGDEASMFEHYLNLLERQYGDKLFHRYMKPLLVNFAIFYDGLTIDELSKLTDDMDSPLMLLATLTDLRGVLSVERTEEGNLYLFANEEYVRYVRRKYAQEVLLAKQSYIDELVEAAREIEHYRAMGDKCWNMRFINNSIKQSFPKVLVLREKIFHYSDIDKPVDSTNPLYNTSADLLLKSSQRLLGGQMTELDFLHDYLRLNVRMGYNHRSFEHSVIILLWALDYFYNLSKDFQKRPIFSESGIKLTWCLAYLIEILYLRRIYIYSSENIQSKFASLVDMFKLLLDMMMEKEIVKDSWELFLIIVSGDYHAGLSSDNWRSFFQYVIKRNEFPLFLAHEEELYSIACESFFISVQDGKVDSALSECPNNTKWRAWLANMKLNMAINGPQSQPIMPLYPTCKKLYDLIITLGGTAKYIPYTPTQFLEWMKYPKQAKESPAFCKIISFLQNDSREGYLKMWLCKAEENNYIPNVSYLCDRLQPTTEEEYQTIVDYCLNKVTERKEYLESCVKENRPLDEKIADECIISKYLTLAYPDDGFSFEKAEELKEFRAFVERRHCVLTHEDEDAEVLLASMSQKEKLHMKIAYKYRVDPAKHAIKLKQWLDKYAIALLLDKTYSCIYFKEFHNYFTTMVKYNQDQLYEDLMNNRLYRDKRAEYSVLYLIFCMHYILKRKDFKTARKLALQYVENIQNHQYHSDTSLFAWNVCQQLLQNHEGPTQDLYKPILDMQEKLRHTNHFSDMIASYCHLGICALMFGDFSSIPAWTKEIDKIVTAAEQRNKESHALYFFDEEKDKAWRQSSIMHLLASLLKGTITSEAFQEEAKTLLHRYKEAEKDVMKYYRMTPGVESILVAMLLTACKHFLSKTVFDNDFSQFDSLGKWPFTFSNNRFIYDFNRGLDVWLE